jgi:hypothetical protein
MTRLVDTMPLVGVDESFAAELDAWIASSPRFRAFVETHHDKIRKKLRGAADAESRRDVRAELAVARALLEVSGATLAFEAYGAQQLGPDFTLTIGAARTNIEVTRLRRPPTEAAIAGAILGKLRQFPPSIANVLVIAIDGATVAPDHVAVAVRAVRARADGKDDAFFKQRGFGGTRGFWDRFLRLTAVVVWSPVAASAASWVNGSARIAVPARPWRAIHRALGGG